MLSKCACLGTKYISFSETRILKINTFSPYDNKINTLQWECKGKRREHLNAENLFFLKKKEKHKQPFGFLELSDFNYLLISNFVVVVVF